MRTIIPLFCLLILSTTALAGVYRWVDDDGNVHFSDREVDGAQEVELQVYQPPTPAAPPAPPEEPPPTEAAQAVPTNRPPPPPAAGEPVAYQPPRVISPTPNQTLISPRGAMRVVYATDPPLRPGDSVQLLLDGREVMRSSQSKEALLQDVGFGSHALTAVILDGSGKELARSPLINFSMRFGRPPPPPRL